MARASEEARLTARPRIVPLADMTSGEHEVEGGRGALLAIPSSYDPSRPAPLAVMFHGAGQGAPSGLDLLRPLAEDAGLLLLAPQSQGRTWDRLSGHFGPDFAALDVALGQVLARLAVDASRVAIGGFSDGASYALSIGLANGDLVSHVLAFSPGFMAAPIQRGLPAVFISHGVHDPVLPIDRCSRRIVPALQNAGYAIEYREFDGPHTLPPGIARDAVDWFTGRAPE